MTDRPIIFSAPMVRALLAGTKTQTRRIAWHRCRPGDRLWVREAWAPLSACTHNDPGTQAMVERGFYRADNGTIDGEISKWRPSIHMPRWASRLTLTVTEVRVRRLQSISEADAMAEGAPSLAMDDDGKFYQVAGGTHRCGFAGLWNSINGPDAWERNPEVVALTFTVARRYREA